MRDSLFLCRGCESSENSSDIDDDTDSSLQENARGYTVMYLAGLLSALAQIKMLPDNDDLATAAGTLIVVFEHPDKLDTSALGEKIKAIEGRHVVFSKALQAPLGRFLISHMQGSLRKRVNEDSSLRRVSVLVEMYSEYNLDCLQSRLAVHGVGHTAHRLMEITQDLRCVVAELKKVTATCGSDSMAAPLREFRGKIQSCVDVVSNAVREFVMELVGIIKALGTKWAKAASNKMSGFEPLIDAAVSSLNKLTNYVSNICFDNMASNDEACKVLNRMQDERASFLASAVATSKFVVQLELKETAGDADMVKLQDVFSLCSGTFNVDANFFVGGSLPQWKESTGRESLVVFKRDVHESLQGRMYDAVSKWYSNTVGKQLANAVNMVVAFVLTKAVDIDDSKCGRAEKDQFCTKVAPYYLASTPTKMFMTPIAQEVYVAKWRPSLVAVLCSDPEFNRAVFLANLSTLSVYGDSDGSDGTAVLPQDFVQLTAWHKHYAALATLKVELSKI